MSQEIVGTEVWMDTEADFRCFADQAPFPVWISDAQLNRIYFNASWLSYTGRTLDQEAGKGWRDAVHPEDREEIDCSEESALENQSEFQSQFRLQSSYGDYRPFLELAYPRYSSEGTFLGFIGCGGDRNLFDRTLRRFQQMAREKEEIAHVLSHDLKAPLRAIEGFSEALLEDCADVLNPDAREHLREIADGVGRLRTLMDDLVAFARLGRDILALNPVNSQDLLHEAIANLQEKIEESEAEVRLIGDFPILEGHRRSLCLLFESLIDNSLKFRRSDTAPTITVEAVTHDSHHLFVYSDNGIGIDPNYREEVFGLFRRLHVVSEYPGSGIGLALARKAVELHEGKIQIVPAEQSGTTFEIRIPRPPIVSGLK
ncbi:MAG: PAS domain-containing protein [Candidatus Omnitrophica bacterium]|nr:PAS domain-containing protein [Candidatus Omnitrophota bacterium]